MNFIRNVTNKFIAPASQNFQQVRTKYVNRWMIRDVKRRKAVTEHAVDTLRYRCLYKNDILPRELREIAHGELTSLPRDSLLKNLTYRCVVTSRPRGQVHRWRLSRIVFRHLADYNKLAGVQRAMW